MKKIENPKIFISYCWSNDDYIIKVVDFANADCLLTNISILVTGDYWFALSYVYLNDRESDVIKEISISLKSHKLSKDFYMLFDTDKDNLQKSLKKWKNTQKNTN